MTDDFSVTELCEAIARCETAIRITEALAPDDKRLIGMRKAVETLNCWLNSALTDVWQDYRAVV